MTTEQQQIIDSLISEFTRINQSKGTSTKFNLIDTSVLDAKTKEINEFKANEKLDIDYWKRVADTECKRIVQMLKEDMPNNCIQQYGDNNNYYPDSSILLRHNAETSTHSDSCADIHIVVDRGGYVEDSYGNRYSRGTKLQYRVSPSKESSSTYYDTIEEAILSLTFLERVRTHIIR
jgi:hypothetical protein